MNTDKFDKAAATWDENPGRVKMANNIANAILDAVELTPAMNVMDFGCGTGLISMRLQPLVGSITAVDSAAGMLEVLNRKLESKNINNIKTRHLDIEQGDILEGTYDLTISSMTLHHIQDIKAILKQFSQITNRGGYLCIADLDPDQGYFHGDNTGVQHFGFEREKMRELLQESGFGQVEFRTAAEIVRFAPEGLRPFTIFLATARRLEK